MNFAAPTEMINDVASSGRKMVTIIDPHIKVDNNYYIYKNGFFVDILVKKIDGSNFHGFCWPGNSVYADFFLLKARKFIAEQYEP